MANNNLKQVILYGAALDKFNRLKEKLSLENDSDVLRFSIAFTEKRYK